MTVKEFYEWCKEEDALDYELVVSVPERVKDVLDVNHRVCDKNDNICFYNVRKHVEINAWEKLDGCSIGIVRKRG